MSALAQLRPTEVVVFHHLLNLIDRKPYRSVNGGPRLLVWGANG